MLNDIIKWFEAMDPVQGAFIATLFTWALTALGASIVFFCKDY